MKVDEMWDYLEDNMIATKDETSMKDILYAKTGYRSFDQLEEEES